MIEWPNSEGMGLAKLLRLEPPACMGVARLLRREPPAAGPMEEAWVGAAEWYRDEGGTGLVEREMLAGA